MNKVTILMLLMLIINISCADSKTFEIDGKQVTVEPYGWADLGGKNKEVKYKANVGNVVLSIIFCQTIVAPVVLTGWYLFEPIELKTIKQ